MKQLLYIFIVFLILGCGTPKATDTQAYLLDIREIAAHAEVEVHPMLGKGKREEVVKIDGRSWPKYTYKDGAVEIVYINGKADWITISLNEGKFDKTALGIIGLPVAEPTEASKNVLRWENYEGIKEISLFPKADGTIDYFYLKVLTK